MYIKYKGQIGALLRDISLQYKIPVNLKIAEIILETFFKQSLQELSEDKAIALICNLPPFLKPFCILSKNTSGSKQILGMESGIAAGPMMKILEKYVSHEKMALMYAVLPDHCFLTPNKISYFTLQDRNLNKVS